MWGEPRPPSEAPGVARDGGPEGGFALRLVLADGGEVVRGAGAASSVGVRAWERGRAGYRRPQTHESPPTFGESLSGHVAR